MRYLIIHDNKPFYTNWYDYENNYASGMIVINLFAGTYTNDGVNWMGVEGDCL